MNNENISYKILYLNNNGEYREIDYNPSNFKSFLDMKEELHLDIVESCLNDIEFDSILYFRYEGETFRRYYAVIKDTSKIQNLKDKMFGNLKNEYEEDIIMSERRIKTVEKLKEKLG